MPLADLLAQSLKRDVEALIFNNEGAVAFLVLLDFREGYERKAGSDRVKWCWDWMLLYRTTRSASMNRVSLARTR